MRPRVAITSGTVSGAAGCGQNGGMKVLAHVLTVLLALLLANPPAVAQPAAPPAWPAAQPPVGMSLHAVPTGRMFARAALAYRGGAWDEERTFVIGGILVRHPGGNLLFDAGFGSDVDAHFKTTPLIAQWLSRYEKGVPAARQLADAGVALKAVVLTHAHWDHVSGLADLGGVPVWLAAREQAFVASGDAATALARMLGTASYTALAFDSGPYMGFATSKDVFGDGSVVLVPAPGHTPGSLVAFVLLPGGQRYALISDLAWQIEGVDGPAPKHWLASRLADADGDATLAMLRKMHALKAAHPQLQVVPAHDARVWARLPGLGAAGPK